LAQRWKQDEEENMNKERGVQSEVLWGKGSVTNGCTDLQAVPASDCGKSCVGAKAELM